ncbi:MAG: NAD(P)H-dependent oxidoreductase subunit E, partial [Deltaproteobacteria bacterium]|nr:NAD(P)H-dependent oxidoreductase subunit E [Deltaproteobacteria bacterium]
LIAGITGTSASEIFGIITFYAQFRLKPLGRFLVRQCQGTACHVNGAKELQDVMEDELGIPMGETDGDGLFTLSKVACLGCCSLAPVLMINDDTHGRLDTSRVRKILRSHRKKAREEAKS